MHRATIQFAALQLPSIRRVELIRTLMAAVSVLCIMVSTGCGGATGPTRYDVSGTVTYNGQPVPEGFIRFVPDSSQGNEGPATSANIVAGRFDTSGQGSVGGPHLVVINGFDGNARPEDELPHGMPLFPEYHTTADLPKSASSMDFEVPR